MTNFKLKELEEKYFKLENEVFELQKQLQLKKISLQDFELKKNELTNNLKTLKSEILTLKDNISSGDKISKRFLIDELIELQNNFQVDYNSDLDKATKGKVYISATPYDHFRFVIDFHKFPKKPIIQFSSEVKELLNKTPDEVSPTLNSWDKNKPGHFVDIFQEIENALIDTFGYQIDSKLTESQKLAARRKSIRLAKEAEENGELQDAIWFLENVIKISEDLHEFDKIEKYKQKILELKQKIDII
ncbi:MAG: hypothetical protein ACTSPY_05325 [Candidatus Helarchaeota archaeon]